GSVAATLLGSSNSPPAPVPGVAEGRLARWGGASAPGGASATPGAGRGPPAGSGGTLPDKQARHIQDRIDNQSPAELGIPSPLWSRRAVRDLIRQEVGITMPVRTVGEDLRRWGYTAKRPRRHARQQDPDEDHEWLVEA